MNLVFIKPMKDILNDEPHGFGLHRVYEGHFEPRTA